MKRILFLMFVLLFALPSIASAHAELVNSQPKEGETVQQSIDTLTLQFGEEVEKFIRFTMTNGNGESIPLDTPSISGKTVLVMTKKPLPAGDYTAKWELVSADGHNATGQLTFKVGQVKEKTEKSDQPTKTNTNTNQDNPSSTSSNHQTLYIVIVVVLAAILAIGGMTIFRKKKK